jgi:hypothetical protein
METVGIFHLTDNVNTTQLFVLYPNKSIEWFGGKSAPVDVPTCGFDGERCVDNTFRLSKSNMKTYAIYRRYIYIKACLMIA